MDLILILDRSGSMRDEMPDLKRVAIALVDQLDMTHARAGLISFSGAASEDQVLTDSHDALHTAINSLQAGGATNIVAALTAAAAKTGATTGSRR